MNMNFDGIGTKVEIAERVGDHSTMAYDLFAMVCDDAARLGAEPVLIGSILDVNSLGNGDESFVQRIVQLAKGYIGAAKAANVAIVNGEVAELGGRVGGYGDFRYNWGAAVVWFGNKNRIFTGKEILKGDYLVGLEEPGFRSNGISLVRRVLEDFYGHDWHKHGFEKSEKTVGELALTPSKIYSSAVVNMTGGYANEPRAKIHGVAHITGGGIPGKLGRVLKHSGLGAIVDNPFEPSEFLKHVQFWGEVEDREAYRTWNMGQGMIIITPEPEKVMSIAKEYEINSQLIGQVTEDKSITIKSKGCFKEGEDLVFSEDKK
jgi:phosphoribosylformylglycinamidine cyclo-ligase